MVVQAQEAKKRTKTYFPDALKTPTKYVSWQVYIIFYGSVVITLDNIFLGKSTLFPTYEQDTIHSCVFTNNHDIRMLF